MLNSAGHELFLLINIKVPTIVSIFTFMRSKIAFWAYLSVNKAEFLGIFYTYEHLEFHAQLS